MTRSSYRKALRAHQAQVQAEAARRNGALSQGPATPEGKARSSQNAITHGLTAQHAVVHPGEQETYAAFIAGLEQELKPEGVLETTFFEQLARAAWNLRRIAALEAQLFQSTGQDPLFLLTPDPLLEKKVNRLYRYKASNQRDFNRALQELKFLQTNRFARTGQAEAIPANCPPLASVAAFTKRTQPASQRRAAAPSPAQPTPESHPHLERVS